MLPVAGLLHVCSIIYFVLIIMRVDVLQIVDLINLYHNNNNNNNKDLERRISVLLETPNVGLSALFPEHALVRSFGACHVNAIFLPASDSERPSHTIRSGSHGSGQ